MAHQKTEAVILRGKRDRTKVVFNLVGVVVVPAKNVKYLGIWIDSKMTYGEHVKKSVETANNVTAALSGVLLNVGGPGYWKKKYIQRGTVHSTVWSSSLVQGHQASKVPNNARKCAEETTHTRCLPL